MAVCGRSLWCMVGWSAILLLAAAACAPAPPERPAAPGAPAAPGPPAGPKSGGTFRTLERTDPVDIDPHTSTVGAQEFWNFIGNTLLQWNEKLEFQPSLAKSWEYSPDSKVLTLKLNEGVKFHNKAPVNGREMLAEDVVYSLQRITTDKPQFAKRTQFAAIERFEAADKYTIRLHFKVPDASVLGNLGYVENQVVAREVVEQYGDLKDPLKTGIGTGAFMITEWSPGVGVKFVKNPDYWRPGKPHVDRAEWTIVKDASARVAAFRSGQIDYLQPIDLPEKEDLTKSNPDTVWLRAAEAVWVAFLPQRGKPPFNDARVVAAVDLAVDRDEIIKAVGFGEGEIQAAIPFWLPQFSLPQEELKKRPDYGGQPMDRRIAEVRRLVAEAGHGGGLKFKAMVPERARSRFSEPVAIVMQQQLKRAGIDMEIAITEWGAVQNAQNQGIYEDSMVYAYAAGIDPNDYLRVFYASKGSRNYSKWSDPKLDELVERQSAETDPQKRQQLVFEAQRQILDSHVLPQLFAYYRWEALKPHLKGLQTNARARYYYWSEDLWIDK